MRHWFINPADDRLRAGWRILLFVALFVALAVGGQLGVRAALGSLPKGSSLTFAIIAIAATVAVFICRRHLDKKSFVSLGLGGRSVALKDLVFGFLLSAAMAACVLALMLGAGVIEELRFSWGVDGLTPRLLLAALLPTILIGYWEELVNRGYLFQNMREGMGLVAAVLLSCVLYGILHAANPNASWLSSLIIVGFGLLRLYGYLATGLLWLSIGMHIGWNFFQGTVFGFPASGHAEAHTLLSHERVGPGWLSGGDFGPEGSLLILPVIGLALAAMHFWARSPLRSAWNEAKPAQANRNPVQEL